MKIGIRARLKWIELYKEACNAGLVCRRCGISRELPLENGSDTIKNLELTAYVTKAKGFPEA